MHLNTIFDAINAVSPVSLIIALSTIFITIAYLALKGRGVPPGPVGLPYFGYWPFINNNYFHLKLDEMKKRYGDILSFTCTGRLYISLGSIKVAREAFITKAECFGDRMLSYSAMGHILKNEETTLGKYRIPKGAVLLLNFYSSHHDNELYEEPEKFNPSRFIQTEGKRKKDSPIIFGLGKRSCVGEGYVLMQVFLIISTLIQNFQLSLPEGSKKLSIEEFATSSLLVCATPRAKN
ncbi:unnamed protein product [Larinioides sclopetarius]|uniref:unspecific monooxygenase n=1 Tax=Larinioides sclopetarius TaxID=280406 RepID=A0AAV1YY39_9ARAC